MIVPKIQQGDVICVLLPSGQEMMCKVKVITSDVIWVDKPMVPVMGQSGAQLAPATMFQPSSAGLMIPNGYAPMYVLSPEATKVYESATSGILTP